MKFVPVGARYLKHYLFLVITETPNQERPPRNRQLFDEFYHLGQILVCDDNDGYPLEVGTGVKPSRLNFLYEKFDLLNEAIEFSYETVNGGFDHKRVGRHKNTWQKGKKLKKFRHKA